MSATANISSFLRGIAEARRRALDAGRQAVDRSGEHMLTQARKITPVSPTDPKNPHYIGTSGTLQNSATAEPASVNGTKITKIVGFNTSYASAVHENLKADHHYPGSGNPHGQAKYLESVLKAGNGTFTTYVQNAMRATF